MTTELKPCPFCRYPNLDFVETVSSTTLQSVSCSNCGALGPCARNRQDAADKWNSAPRPEPRVEREPVGELTFGGTMGGKPFAVFSSFSLPVGTKLYAAPLQREPSELDKLDALMEAFNNWPLDIRKKLSLHDLRRMTGWAPPIRRDPTDEECARISKLSDAAFHNLSADSGGAEIANMLSHRATGRAMWQAVEQVRNEIQGGCHD